MEHMVRDTISEVETAFKWSACLDYRAGVYNLKEGRDPLRRVVGPGAEELAFAICTSDRLGLIFDLLVIS